ncbi:MAG: hypothetical protein GX550_01715 [Syntrophomonadaceae bacterium]|jgi:hypothetical protein|nr:hypothetical protein [Syntrophomonadaceae bacterium]
MAKNRNELKFEIINELGAISEGSKGWRKELNRISWNGGEPKYDIRDWASNHERMGKGVTLTEYELRQLKELIDAEIAFLEEDK